MVDLIHDDEFVFWLPFEFEKAQKDGKEKGKRWIQGVASTPDMDLQKEIVEKQLELAKIHMNAGFKKMEAEQYVNLQ